MDKYNQVMKRLLPALRDVVGIDFGTSSVKAVRIRADGSGRRTVIAAGVLPKIDLLGGEANAELLATVTEACPSEYAVDNTLGTTGDYANDRGDTVVYSLWDGCWLPCCGSWFWDSFGSFFSFSATLSPIT